MRISNWSSDVCSSDLVRTRERAALMPDDLPNLDAGCVDTPSLGRLSVTDPSTHPPRILLFYGSLRERSYSRFLTFEAERLLRSEEHTSELQSLMRISYAVFCLTKKQYRSKPEN